MNAKLRLSLVLLFIFPGCIFSLSSENTLGLLLNKKGVSLKSIKYIETYWSDLPQSLLTKEEHK